MPCAHGRNTIMMMKLRFLAPIMVVTACGGGNAETQHPTLVTPPPAATASVTPESLEKDPVALFPGGALGMFSLDLHAFYASQSAGTVAAQVAEKYFPIGAEAGFSASRDLDRVLGGIYSMQGVDVLATLIGRFDEAKIVQAARSQDADTHRRAHRRVDVRQPHALHRERRGVHCGVGAPRARGDEDDHQTRARPHA